MSGAGPGGKGTMVVAGANSPGARDTGRAVVTPANPVLLLAAGKLACRALEELSQVARALHVRIAGPFGYVAVHPAEQGASEPRLWVQPELPAPDGAPGQPPSATDFPSWQEGLRTLLRRLRPASGAVPYG